MVLATSTLPHIPPIGEDTPTMDMVVMDMDTVGIDFFIILGLLTRFTYIFRHINNLEHEH